MLEPAEGCMYILVESSLQGGGDVGAYRGVYVYTGRACRGVAM
jgi:hypothetical protein